MPEPHHWQCSFHADQNPHECDCGVSGPRAWWLDHLPHDRAPNETEANAWRHAIRALEEELGAAHEPEGLSQITNTSNTLQPFQRTESIIADVRTDGSTAATLEEPPASIGTHVAPSGPRIGSGHLYGFRGGVDDCPHCGAMSPDYCSQQHCEWEPHA